MIATPEQPEPRTALDTLGTEFADWRTTRKSRRTPVPVSLRIQAIELLATEPADFRKGMDGFIALCRLSLKQDPRREAHFVFINRKKTLVRALSYDGTGFWLMTKRLSKGTFQDWPTRGDTINTFSAKQLSQLLKGESISVALRKKSL